MFSMLELITNCPILFNFCNLYKERNKEVDIDYEYEIQKKYQNKIEKLKEEIRQLSGIFMPITEKPIDYETNIFKACKEGKLESIEWLIEKENEDKYKRVEKYNKELNFYKDDTPIHIALQNDHLPIVLYLIEKHHFIMHVKKVIFKLLNILFQKVLI